MTFLLLGIGFLCFALTFLLQLLAVPVSPRLNLVALGLACWILIPLIGAWP